LIANSAWSGIPSITPIASISRNAISQIFSSRNSGGTHLKKTPSMFAVAMSSSKDPRSQSVISRSSSASISFFRTTRCRNNRHSGAAIRLMINRTNGFINSASSFVGSSSWMSSPTESFRRPSCAGVCQGRRPSPSATRVLDARRIS